MNSEITARLQSSFEADGKPARTIEDIGIVLRESQQLYEDVIKVTEYTPSTLVAEHLKTFLFTSILNNGNIEIEHIILLLEAIKYKND